MPTNAMRLKEEKSGHEKGNLKGNKRAGKITEKERPVSMTPNRYTVIILASVKTSRKKISPIPVAAARIRTPILVLDDSTSALDMETEYEIQSHLAEKKDVSKIIIAHRISSVQSADEILYLDHGRIAERGTHESLMAQKGLYYSTWEAQYGDYHKAKAALEQALPANA